MKKKRQRSLFGDEEHETKIADFASIEAYFLERLEAVFERVAKKPLLLCNSRGTPIYLLCFAAGNVNNVLVRNVFMEKIALRFDEYHLRSRPFQRLT